MTLKAGDAAPAWKGPDQDGRVHDDNEYRGTWLLLYFYPKDDSPGCTAEACSFRDHFPALKKKGIAVVGISADDETSHKKFASKCELPFTLIADNDKAIVRAYGVWGKKSMYGKEYDGIFRTTFLLDPSGTIAKVYEKVKPENHAAEILTDFESLTS
jgi:peroxiredoxin Q/BCP